MIPGREGNSDWLFGNYEDAPVISILSMLCCGNPDHGRKDLGKQDSKQHFREMKILSGVIFSGFINGNEEKSGG